MFFHYELTHNIHYAASCIIMILSVNKVTHVHYKRPIIVQKPIKDITVFLYYVEILSGCSSR